MAKSKRSSRTNISKSASAKSNPPTATTQKKLSRRGQGVRLAPSLLAADFTRLDANLKALKPIMVNWLHLDIMDGHFVPNISFGPSVVERIRPVDPNLYFDVHLMINNPRDYVKQFVDAGAQNITFHVEAAGEDSANLLKYIRRQKIHAGISIKPKTPVSEIKELLRFTDLVLVMTVEPGFGGQSLIPATLNKVRELVLLREELDLDYLIEVDGGIDPSTAHLAAAAGADVLVAGTSIFRGNKIRQNVRDLRKSLHAIV